MTNGFDIFQSFDPTSAFFTKVVNKKKKAPTQESSQSSSKKDRSREKAHHGGKSEEEVRVKGISIIISVVYFSFQPVLHDWCNKGCGVCYPVCGMVPIKDPLLLIGKSSDSRFPLSLSEWSFTICPTRYNRK